MVFTLVHSISRFLVHPSKASMGKNYFSVSSVQRLKEIVVSKTEKSTVIEGKFFEPPWKDRLLKNESGKACVLCAINLDVKHTDVKILSQFVTSDGRMLPRRITGLCKTQQKKVGYMVIMAHKAGLMSNLMKHHGKKDLPRRKWEKFNMYFDESTISLPREYQKKEPQLLKYV